MYSVFHPLWDWLQAHTLGLVDDIGLQKVVNSACHDLRWARARYASQRDMDWDRVIGQLNKDIIAANDFLPDDRQVGIAATSFCLAVTRLASLESSQVLPCSCHCYMHCRCNRSADDSTERLIASCCHFSIMCITDPFGNDQLNVQLSI